MKVTKQEATKAGHEKRSLLKVIRAKCLDCSAGSEKEVRECHLTDCDNWPYRMGNNPFSTRKASPAALEALRRHRQQQAAASSD